MTTLTPESPLKETTLLVRPAEATDVPLILTLIGELADYEKLSHEAVATEALLGEHLFGPTPRASVLLAFEQPADNAEPAPVGFALMFYNFSTFRGKPGIYLEDLFIRPAYRGKGYGKTLLSMIHQRAMAEGCGRVEWSVLDWNTPAIEFYKAFGAKPMDDWTVYRMSLPD